MKNDMTRMFDDCSSVAEACDIQIEVTREALSGVWPEVDEWDSETPYRSLDQAISDMRSAFDRCISFGRAYADELAKRPDIDSVSDDEIYRVLIGLLACDMPELSAAEMPEATARAARTIVRMALNERLAEIRLEAIARKASAAVALQTSEDPIGEAGRLLGEMQALRAPHRFDVFSDQRMLDSLRQEAADYFPLLRDMSTDDAESCLALILSVAAARLAEVRASYTPPASDGFESPN